MQPETLYYLIGVNVIAFLVFGWDKRASMNMGWRISEKALLTLAIIGGSVGCILGSEIFRHKTRKQPFRTLLYGTIILQVIALAFMKSSFAH